MFGRLVLNLLKFRDTIAVLHWSITINRFSLQLSRIVLIMWKLQMFIVPSDNVKPISSGGLTLPTTHSSSINHTTALHINLILRAKELLL